MVAISDSTVLHKSYEEKEKRRQITTEIRSSRPAKLQIQKRRSQLWYNQKVQINQKRITEKRKLRKILHICIHVERGKRWTQPPIHGQHHLFLDGSTLPAQIFGRNSTEQGNPQISGGSTPVPNSSCREKAHSTLYIYLVGEIIPKKI